MSFEVHNPEQPPAPGGGSNRVVFRAVLGSAIVIIALIGWLALGIQDIGTWQPGDDREGVPQELVTALVLTPTQGQPSSRPQGSGADPVPTQTAPSGAVFFTSSDHGVSRLMATFPGAQQAVELTSGAYQVRDPAVSPDGGSIAFASDMHGAWDLFLMNIRTLEIRSLTDTAPYDGHPSWSPDGNWLAYESYADGDLDIWLMPIDGSQPPLQLTNHPAVDAEPDWDHSGGRRIAFVSNRGGARDVYLADLDRPGERFVNLTDTPNVEELDPQFDPSGTRIAYASREDGLELIWIEDVNDPGSLHRRVGTGSQPAWSPSGDALLALLRSPNESTVVTYKLEGDPIPTAFIRGVGGSMELVWAQTGIPWSGASNQSGLLAFQPLDRLSTVPDAAESSSGQLVDLAGVSAPTASLIEPAARAFEGLRTAALEQAGWDVVGDLENAFVGVNEPLPPGFAYNDWLYTGRGFSLPEELYQSGTLQVVREDFGGQTYWRIYVRTVPQSGEHGRPMEWQPWDFGARYVGDSQDYDAGGREQDQTPGGYYLDFTGLAAQFGFQRQPALPNWRTFYPGARFGEFAFTEGLDWTTAMRQLYPDSAIATPTVFATPTRTPTRTPWPSATPWWYWATPTASPSAVPTIPEPEAHP